MYRPYSANLLTNGEKIVNFMAISDHVFGCYKLQFCTVQNAKSRIGRCKSVRIDEMWRLTPCGLTLERMRNFLPSALYVPRLSTRDYFSAAPICMRISFAVPIASSTLLTTCVARERLVSSAAFFSRSSACARMMPSWLFNW